MRQTIVFCLFSYISTLNYSAIAVSVSSEAWQNFICILSCNSSAFRSKCNGIQVRKFTFLDLIRSYVQRRHDRDIPRVHVLNSTYLL